MDHLQLLPKAEKDELLSPGLGLTYRVAVRVARLPRRLCGLRKERPERAACAQEHVHRWRVGQVYGGRPGNAHSLPHAVPYIREQLPHALQLHLRHDPARVSDQLGTILSCAHINFQVFY